MRYYCSVCRTYHDYHEYQEPRRGSASINIDDLVEEVMRRMRGEYTDTYMSQAKPDKPKELTRDEKLQVMARQNDSPSERDNARRMLKAKGLSW